MPARWLGHIDPTSFASPAACGRVRGRVWNQCGILLRGSSDFTRILPFWTAVGPDFAMFHRARRLCYRHPLYRHRSSSMKIGVPKEIKIHEYRVGLVPAGVRELVDGGHQVLVQTGAGAGIGFDDSHYLAAGAKVAATPAEVFATSDLVIKVKEPQLAECRMLRPGQVLFTYLHLAADLSQAQALIASRATAIAYETVTAADGS